MSISVRAMAVAAALTAGLGLVGAATAQTVPAAVAEWRTVAPENLLIIDTSRGRVLVELAADLAPQHAERMRVLADRGFYDGLKFHRVIDGFMAQTGDPLGTGEGSSDLPDLPGEFSFRRGRGSGFVAVPNSGEGMNGMIGALPVRSQPDAQMMVTADFKVAAHGLFCSGVLGMARAADPNTANSQFFLMTARNDTLNGTYTAFGRVVSGLDAVKALKSGPAAQDGRVPGDPDIMVRARMAASLPAAERPTVRVMDTRSTAFAALVEQTRTARGAEFNICDLDVPAQVE